jgi:hypothetical protein
LWDRVTAEKLITAISSFFGIVGQSISVLKFRAQKISPAEDLLLETGGKVLNSTQVYSLIEKEGKGQHCEIWNVKIIIGQVSANKSIDAHLDLQNDVSANKGDKAILEKR